MAGAPSDAAIMKLKSITENKDPFDYDLLGKEMWREQLKKAKDEAGVSFSDENDGAVAERMIKIDQDAWEFTDCKFRCEMRSAGGDWEFPIRYFRCQLVDGYAYGVNQYSNPYFCFIPGKKEGNINLVKIKNGKWSAPDQDGDDAGIEPNERLCWQSLKDYLNDLVQKEIKQVRSGCR